MHEVVRYTFNTRQSVNMDRTELVLRRYTYDADQVDADALSYAGPAKCEVLTVDGFVEYPAGGMLGPELPSFSGLDAMFQQALDEKLAAFETAIRDIVIAQPPTEHFCDYKQALCDLYHAARDAEADVNCIAELIEALNDLAGRGMVENPTNYVKIDAG